MTNYLLQKRLDRHAVHRILTSVPSPLTTVHVYMALVTLKQNKHLNFANATLSPIIKPVIMSFHNGSVNWRKKVKWPTWVMPAIRSSAWKLLSFIITALTLAAWIHAHLCICWVFSLFLIRIVYAWTMEHECKGKWYSKQEDTWKLKLRTVFKCEWETSF